MAWFKKKEEQQIQEDIPRLPELPEPTQFSLPELPDPVSNQNLEELPNLPELPSSPELPNLPELPSSPELSPPNINNQPNLNPEVIKQEIMRPPHEMQKSQFEDIKTIPKKIPSHSKRSPQKSRVKEIEPIYVRLDKFEASLNSFEEIKRKITEVEDVLRKTKEIKQREEQELEAWEREIQIIKSRITAIDKTIFNKLD